MSPEPHPRKTNDKPKMENVLLKIKRTMLNTVNVLKDEEKKCSSFKDKADATAKCHVWS